jgi:hypothetical protein
LHTFKVNRCIRAGDFYQEGAMLIVNGKRRLNMHRCASQILSVLALLCMLRPGMSMQQAKEQAVSFEWLNASGETSGIKYQTHRLPPFSLQNKGGPPVEIEQEETKVDAQTTRITRRAYMTSVNGGRQLTETVADEIRKMSDHACGPNHFKKGFRRPF